MMNETAIPDNSGLSDEEVARRQAANRDFMNRVAAFSGGRDGKAKFKFARKAGDDRGPAQIDCEPSPSMVGVRQANGALVYSEAEKTGYQGWRTKYLPKQPPLDFSGELQQGTREADWNQAKRTQYEDQTGYPYTEVAMPYPDQGIGEDSGPGHTVSEEELAKGEGAMSTGDTNPAVDQA